MNDFLAQISQDALDPNDDDDDDGTMNPYDDDVDVDSGGGYIGLDLASNAGCEDHGTTSRDHDGGNDEYDGIRFSTNNCHDDVVVDGGDDDVEFDIGDDDDDTTAHHLTENLSTSTSTNTMISTLNARNTTTTTSQPSSPAALRREVSYHAFPSTVTANTTRSQPSPPVLPREVSHHLFPGVPSSSLSSIDGSLSGRLRQQVHEHHFGEEGRRIHSPPHDEEYAPSLDLCATLVSPVGGSSLQQQQEQQHHQYRLQQEGIWDMNVVDESPPEPESTWNNARRRPSWTQPSTENFPSMPRRRSFCCDWTSPPPKKMGCLELDRRMQARINPPPKKMGRLELNRRMQATLKSLADCTRRSAATRNEVMKYNRMFHDSIMHWNWKHQNEHHDHEKINSLESMSMYHCAQMQQQNQRQQEQQMQEKGCNHNEADPPGMADTPLHQRQARVGLGVESSPSYEEVRPPGREVNALGGKANGQMLELHFGGP